jgi:hypothetical protein
MFHYLQWAVDSRWRKVKADVYEKARHETFAVSLDSSLAFADIRNLLECTGNMRTALSLGLSKSLWSLIW